MPPTINVAMLGAGWIAKSHVSGMVMLPMSFYPPVARPVLKVVAEASEEAARTAADRYGFERWTTHWHDAVNDPAVDAVVILLPNSLHKEAVLAAVAAGKDIMCEKPLANSLEDAKEMYDAVRNAGIVHQVALSFRFLPAVEMAKRLIEEGEIGRIREVRGFWLVDSAASPNAPLTWRFQKKLAGSGTLGDNGSHIIDMTRYLVGEIVEVCGFAQTVVEERAICDNTQPIVGTMGIPTDQFGPVDVEDSAGFLCRFDQGALGSFQISRSSLGRKRQLGFEIHGENGSLIYDYQRMNELQFYSSRDRSDISGFRTIHMSRAHPYAEGLEPEVLLHIGFNESKMLMYNEFVKAVVSRGKARGDFYDGFKASEVVDAVLRSVEEHRWVQVGWVSG